MTRFGIYGGSFDPPHRGHLRAALAFFDELSLDELVILPAGTPPHKEPPTPFTPALRLELARAAFSPENVGGRAIFISDEEIARGGVSYTADSLSALSRQGRRLFLLCGSDMFCTLGSWRDPARIFSLCTPVAALRGEESEGERVARARERYRERYGADCPVLSAPPLALSSTAIREATRRGEEIAGAVPPGVGEILREKGLYGEESVLAALRGVVRERERPSRAAHSFSVEEECARLAAAFALGERESFFLRAAAILHDLTHGLPLDEQAGILRQGGIPEEEIASLLRHPRTVHQTTAAILLPKDPATAYVAAPEVTRAVSYHTTGGEEMSRLDKLLCLADYIEPNRPYARCRALRRDFWEDLSRSPDKDAALDRALLRYFDETIAYIRENPRDEGALDPRTLSSRAALAREMRARGNN